MGVFNIILSNFKNMKKAKKIRNMSKDEVLALNDEEFFDAVECLCQDAVFDITRSDINEEQKLVYSLNKFEAEVNNGGLCQFFVNSSRAYAALISEYLEIIGALEHKKLYDDFVEENNINLEDLSFFDMDDLREYEEKANSYPFDEFDDAFCELTDIEELLEEFMNEKL